MEYTSTNWKGQQLTITIYPKRDEKLDSFSLRTLRDRYLLPEEKTAQEAFGRAAIAFSENVEAAQRIYNYASKNWFMFATPVLANGGTRRGLPISCYLNSIEDSREGILAHYNENAWLSSLGGGIGGYWGNIRANGAQISRGGTSTGVIPFMCVVDKEMLAFNQGSTRRGSYAAYLPISHPEIEEFLRIRDTSGDQHRRVSRKGFHTAVIIDDEFMNALEQDENYSLVDPHSHEVKKVLPAKTLWREILAKRHETGEPYIMFKDTVDINRPVIYQANNTHVKQSNLCSEIMLATGRDHHGKERTAVCCLSSVNLEKYDDWKDDDQFIFDMVEFLDNTLQAFIDEAPDVISNARYAAIRERSLGLGAMGFHAFLQDKGVPFESVMATSWNQKMFKHIYTQAKEATHVLAQRKGSCPDAEDAGLVVRNVNVIAIAPNASSSIMCNNTSPGIEPFASNFYKQATLSGTNFYKNKALDKLLKTKYIDSIEQLDDVWADISRNDGSVQHFEWMEQEDKDVFKTAFELDQHWVVQHAATRQPFICQSQSLNLFFPAHVSGKYLDSVHKFAWKNGVKTLYYLRSRESAKAEGTGVGPEENKLKDYQEPECFGCAN